MPMLPASSIRPRGQSCRRADFHFFRSSFICRIFRRQEMNMQSRMMKFSFFRVYPLRRRFSTVQTEKNDRSAFFPRHADPPDQKNSPRGVRRAPKERNKKPTGRKNRGGSPSGTAALLRQAYATCKKRQNRVISPAKRNQAPITRKIIKIIPARLGLHSPPLPTLALSMIEC